ncbi:hypothetical protein LJB98_04410 [Bacteroidales bacterium OttesenSCG-928-M11]|nr:hypothetical protein [Bacteroidales bacterium OttesenSCG-928-M11]
MLLLFYAYQEPRSQVFAFNISLLITIAGLFWFPAFILLPLFWYGLHCLQGMNIRSFFATLLGTYTVYFVLFSWAVYINDLNFVATFFPDWETFIRFDFPDWSLHQTISLGFILFLFIISSFQFLVSGETDRVRTKVFLEYLFIFSLCLFLLLPVFSTWTAQWESLLFVPLSLLFARYFSISTGKKTIGLFLFTILFFLGMTVGNFIDIDWKSLYPF